MLKIGDQAPEFSGKDQHGKMVRSSELLVKGPIVLYFYPKDFTPGCTQQACMFRDVFHDLDAKNATVVGVSRDGQASHKRFSDTHGLPFSLISDSKRTISKAYDVERLFGLMLKRVTYIIDEKNVIRAVFHHELAAKQHVEDALTALAAIK
jgi:peroxiredoxin Q/BCP